MTTTQVQRSTNRIKISENAMSIFKAIKFFREGNVPALNLDLDAHLQSGTTIRTCYWTGTGIIYPAPDRAFSDFIIVRDGRMGYEVPFRYQGMRNAGLILETDLDVEIKAGGGYFLLKGTVTSVTENLPKTDDWYLTDFRGIPCGKKVSKNNPEAREWVHDERHGFAGLIVRGSNCNGTRHSRSINAYLTSGQWPSPILHAASLDQAQEVAPTELAVVHRKE
jgi:hypothetical protein